MSLRYSDHLCAEGDNPRWRTIIGGQVKVNPFNLDSMAGSVNSIGAKFSAAASAVSAAGAGAAAATQDPHVGALVESAVKQIATSLQQMGAAYTAAANGLTQSASAYTATDFNAAAHFGGKR